MNDEWRDVEAGRRQLDWAVAVGDPAEAEYLTSTGRRIASQAIMDLEAFFGPAWLHRATHPAPGMTGPTMGPYFASLLGAPAFVAVVGLWARLQVLVDAKVQGIGQVRKNLRANPTAEEFRHHIALARLAVLAIQAGARITLEPVKPQGGPGDLRAVRADSDVFIEVRALGPDQAFRAYNQRVRDATTHLRVLAGRHGVHWDGDLPPEATLQWKETVALAAAEAAATGVPVEVTVDELTLTAQPDPAPAGARIAGPMWEADQGPRLLQALMGKAVKTQSAGAAWLWLEDAGAVWPLTPFARDPLPQKIDVLRQALDPLFDAHPHVLGVVLTSGEMRLNGLDATEAHHRGAAFRRTTPGSLARESIVVHRRLNVPGQYALITELCTEEPAWLDRALARLGIPGGVTALTTPPARHVPTGAQKHRSGLYLPTRS
ncbi:hypothetical protein [Micromonospora sp. NPDC004704]